MTIYNALYNNGTLVHITTTTPWTGTPALAEIRDSEGKVVEYNHAISRHDFKSFEHAEELAAFATAQTGEAFIAVDEGEHCWPRFDIMIAPKVGDDVSKAFNGDYYPVGKIKRITPGGMVIAEDEGGHVTKFNRRKNTSTWKQVNGYSCMVKGIVSRLNPEF